MPELIKTSSGHAIICRNHSPIIADQWDSDSTWGTEHFAVSVFDDELVQVRCRQCKQMGMFDL